MIGIEEYEEDDFESDLEKDLLAKNELKPCPFCGKDVKVKRYKASGHDWWFVECSNCKINIDPLMWNFNRTKNEIIEIWNKRVSE